MTNDEAARILRIRRDLTGEQFNDGTVEVWREALHDWSPVEVRAAVIAASREHERVTVAHVTKRLSPRTKQSHDEAHSLSCICAGRGWIEVEQRDDRHSWWAWDRCPNGPRTGFVEVD